MAKPLYNSKLINTFQDEEEVSLMMQWAGEERDVSDPWYTRNFEAAYRDIYRACQAILEYFR